MWKKSETRSSSYLTAEFCARELKSILTVSRLGWWTVAVMSMPKAIRNGDDDSGPSLPANPGLPSRFRAT